MKKISSFLLIFICWLCAAALSAQTTPADGKGKKRERLDIYKEVSMDDVVVTGTIVKLVSRGDTLVYNASAFNLPEGSMLDGLVRQMPGAELRDNGDIYINGRKIDYLILNGKDFFRGKNLVMLDNLPYYTVRELKVYDRSTLKSRLVGHDIEKRDYVMDVVLKREYNRGYMANVMAGGGTENRYMARLFGLYYDDHTRLSVFGNVNNINEDRHPGSDGGWEPANMPQGLRTSRQTGLNLNTEDKDKQWEEQFNATFDWSDADDESRVTTERFATGGNLFDGSSTVSQQKDFRLAASNRFTIQKPFMLTSLVNMSYANGRRNSSRRDSTYSSSLVNRTLNESLDCYRTFNIDGTFSLIKKFDWGDFLSLSLSGTYTYDRPNDSYSLNRVHYAVDDSDDLRHYYTDNQNVSYDYSARASYTLQFPQNWHVVSALSYTQGNEWSVSDNYRLDMLEDIGADKRQLEWLPSSREQLLKVLDGENNSHENLLARKYSGSIEVIRSTDEEMFLVQLPVMHVRDRLHYSELAFDTVTHRHYTNFTPGISYNRWRVIRGLSSASYHLLVNTPSLSSILPVGDTTNPLQEVINNPELKSTITHQVGLSFQANNDSLRHFFRLWTDFQLTQRAVGTATYYNDLSGAYTLVSGNVDGNWTGTVAGSYETPLDKQKLLTLKQRADVTYTHSVDFDIVYDEFEDYPPTAPLSTVNNWTLHERLGLEFQKDKLTAGVSGEISWRSATGDRSNFETVSAFDYNYGGFLRYTIPWLKLYVGTDIKMFSRRGYHTAMMNTDDLVWNAELSRSLLKEKLTLKLTAFDLLHQLSSKQYTINAQGRTETWNNCIPRYLMLTAAYKLNIAPK